MQSLAALLVTDFSFPVCEQRCFLRLRSRLGSFPTTFLALPSTLGEILGTRVKPRREREGRVLTEAEATMGARKTTGQLGERMDRDSSKEAEVNMKWRK